MRFVISMLEKDKANKIMSTVNEAKFWCQRKYNQMMNMKKVPRRAMKAWRKTRFLEIALTAMLKDRRILVKYAKNRHRKDHLNR